MRCFPILFLSVFGVALPGQIQEPPPQPLLEAGHCLATAKEDWLGLAHGPALMELGYIADDKSYPGADLQYVVDYTSPTHTDGLVFALLSKGKAPHRVVRLQFKVSFRQSDDGSRKVELIDPPLGGIATQDQIVSAIREIGFHTYSVTTSDLLLPTNSAQCESDVAAQ
ncbi:MAG TPA: hypothetical protein VHZ25_12630 [Acidobacteriaceae bacterium]|jgi:hypothetical protein|nr:hypothetical protein [Acidobacteriaceae bacterium]